MAGFPPVRGSGSPLAGLIGGLAAGLQGYMQGRQFRDQEQMQQQELSGERLKNAMNVFSMLGQIGQSDPQALQSPQMQQFVNQNVGNAFPIPRNPDGGIDTRAFLPSPQTLLSNKSFIEAQPGSDIRKTFAQYVGGNPDQVQQLINMPQVLDTSAANAQLRTYNEIVKGIQTGQVKDPRSVLPQLNAAAAVSGQPMANIGPDGKVYLEGSSSPLEIGEAAQSQIDQRNTGSDKNRAQTDYLNSLAAFTKNKNAWYGKVEQATIDHLKASTGMDEAEMAAIPQRVGIGWMNAHTAANRADYDFQRLQMQQKDFAALGDHTPQAISAYNGLLGGYQKQAASDLTALNNVRSQISNILKSNMGNDPNPQTQSAAAKMLTLLQAQEQHLNARYNTDLQIAQKMRQDHSNFAQRVQTNIVRKLGAPSNVQAVKPKAPPYGPIAHDPKTGKEYKWDAQSGQYRDDQGNPYKG